MACWGCLWEFEKLGAAGEAGGEKLGYAGVTREIGEAKDMEPGESGWLGRLVGWGGWLVWLGRFGRLRWMGG